MKKTDIKYKSLLTTLLCLTFCLSSCNDSFLERAPRDAQSDASFWKTEEDAEKFLIGTFRYLVQTENHTIMTDRYCHGKQCTLPATVERCVLGYPALSCLQRKHRQSRNISRSKKRIDGRNTIPRSILLCYIG